MVITGLCAGSRRSYLSGSIPVYADIPADRDIYVYRDCLFYHVHDLVVHREDPGKKMENEILKREKGLYERKRVDGKGGEGQ